MSFQPDAFQPDAFQRGPLEPRAGFPSDAFQGDAFQIGIAVASGPQGPTITVQPQSQSIPAGGSAVLTVFATGDAPITYQWYQGTSGDTSNPLVGETGTSTTVSPLVATSYWVRATNAVSTADSSTAVVSIGSTGGGIPGKGGKKKTFKKPKRFYVDIDNETFEVSTPEEARFILTRAKEALEEVIESPQAGKLPIKKPKIKVTGMPGPEMNEILNAITGIRAEMKKMYDEASRKAENDYLKALQEDDEDAILVLM